MSDTELLHKSKGEPVQRLEVFTGTGRRRAWTTEQKAEIVAESYAGGTVSTVARRHGLTPQQLFSWRRQACQSGLREAEKSGPSFAPIVIEACCTGKDAATSPALAGAALIEILIGRATVRVTPGVDAASLQAVLRAVMAAT